MNASTTAPFIFSWAPPRKRRSALIIFLIASVILHALCFYIFQIVYPPTVALMPPPARVNLISPDDPESLALLRWVEAEDPALTTTTQRASETKSFALPQVQHVPSYASYQPKLKTLPPPPVDLSIPSSAAIGPVRLPRLHTNAPAPAIVRKTTAQFSEMPATLGNPVLPDFKFHLSRPDAPGNARFRVAIDGLGAVRFCFLIESSGDPALDEEARNFLQLCRFKTNENSSSSDAAMLIWTVATILWGNDLAPASISPTPSP